MDLASGGIVCICRISSACWAQSLCLRCQIKPIYVLKEKLYLYVHNSLQSMNVEASLPHSKKSCFFEKVLCDFFVFFLAFSIGIKLTKHFKELLLGFKTVIFCGHCVKNSP